MDSLRIWSQKGDIANKLGDMKFSDFPKMWGAHELKFMSQMRLVLL